MKKVQQRSFSVAFTRTFSYKALVAVCSYHYDAVHIGCWERDQEKEREERKEARKKISKIVQFPYSLSFTLSLSFLSLSLSPPTASVILH
jgi:hypothetical protein